MVPETVQPGLGDEIFGHGFCNVLVERRIKFCGRLRSGSGDEFPVFACQVQLIAECLGEGDRVVPQVVLYMLGLLLPAQGFE
ncbi:MAG: hypothetical protein Q7T64_00725 [Lacisediminimonas sp.]|nr:hypothetical protein [Lacisediminimonas sp.]